MDKRPELGKWLRSEFDGAFGLPERWPSDAGFLVGGDDFDFLVPLAKARVNSRLNDCDADLMGRKAQLKAWRGGLTERRVKRLPISRSRGGSPTLAKLSASLLIKASVLGDDPMLGPVMGARPCRSTPR